MSKISQIERGIQNHNLQLFQEQLQYKYVFKWLKIKGNSYVKAEVFKVFLKVPVNFLNFI